MEEEKGGVIHIFFIFTGIALLCLGVFYYFTDDKVIYKNTNEQQEEKIVEDIDIVKQISLMNNVEETITLKNKKEVKIKYYFDNEIGIGSFYLDSDLIYETSSDVERCDEFYLYNDSIISYCYYGSSTTGHLYIVDGNGTLTKVNEFYDNDYRFVPESIKLKDNKLIVNGMRISEGSILKINSKEIHLCNKDEIEENNIDIESPAYANYELKLINNDVKFGLIANTVSIKEFISESCKIVD